MNGPPNPLAQQTRDLRCGLQFGGQWLALLTIVVKSRPLRHEKVGQHFNHNMHPPFRIGMGGLATIFHAWTTS
jgi:hypothetical protein